MRWLRHNPVRRLQRDERGVTIAFFALLITAMLIIAALVIDIGALQAEKRELQNGADAAALALAMQCATGENLDGCYADEPGEADVLADGNAKDDLSAVDDVIHGFIDGDPANARTVTVITSTETATGAILPFSFADLFTGTDGQTVHAQATAAWGPPAQASIFAFGISDCVFRAHTAYGTVLDTGFDNIYRASSPEADDPAPACFANPVTIGPARPDDEGDNVLENGFAWFGSTGDACMVDLSVGEWVSEHPVEAQRKGAPPTDCVGPLQTFNGQVALVAIFDDARNIGTGLGEYHISGFAAFRITGYHFSASSSWPDPHPCDPAGPGGEPTCVRGRWVTYDGTIPGVVGGPDFGVVAVQLVA